MSIPDILVQNHDSMMAFRNIYNMENDEIQQPSEDELSAKDEIGQEFNALIHISKFCFVKLSTSFCFVFYKNAYMKWSKIKKALFALLNSYRKNENSLERYYFAFILKKNISPSIDKPRILLKQSQ